MEKIILDDKTIFWKKKLKFIQNKNKLISLIKKNIEHKKNDTDAFNIITISEDINFNGNLNVKNEMIDLIDKCLKECKEIYSEEIKKDFNIVEIGSWINIVRSVNPKQFKHYPMVGLEKYHNHVDINKKKGYFLPHLTFVYYIQMPNVLKEDDGVLYILGDNQVEHKFLPEEDDLIVMPADLPHAPNNAPLSNIDRIVIAGNVGFQYIKKDKTLF